MMPGETHPAAPGTAADLARCQGCASLQQNLNEYVEALITLKQKIINTDNLLTEYQKKCDDILNLIHVMANVIVAFSVSTLSHLLQIIVNKFYPQLQFARRENSTLHHQVEQMLQKISPLQKCQEELGSLKAELEEKKSSLKLYQDTHREYARVKEECLKSDAQKKKLEAKVKKLEEAAVKQTQDLKQLRNAKKALEKEFKKTQEKLHEFSKRKNEKELRHIGTQISSGSYGNIDKRKVKLLLKELWLCVNTTHRLPGDGGGCVPEKSGRAVSLSGARRGDGWPPEQGRPPGTSDVRKFLTKLSMEVQGDFASSDSTEEELPRRAGPRPGHASNEQRHPKVSVQGPSDRDRTRFSDRGHFLDDDLQAAIDFFKLPPPLLSPVPSPPLTASACLYSGPSPASETYFGDYTDSSDNDSASLSTSSESTSEDDEAEPQTCFALFKKNKMKSIYVGKNLPWEAFQALDGCAVKRKPAAPSEPSQAAGRPPSTSSSAPGGLCAAGPGVGHSRERAVSAVAEKQAEAGETSKSACAEKGPPKPGQTPRAGALPPLAAQRPRAAAEESELSCPPLVRRTLTELVQSEEKMMSAKIAGLPQAELTRTLTGETTFRSGPGMGSDHFQRVSREMAKERKGPARSTLGSPESRAHEPGSFVGAMGLTAKATFPSSSTSVPASVGGSPQAARPKLSKDAEAPAAGSLALHRPGQNSQTRALSACLVQPRPPVHSARECTPGSSLPAGSPQLPAAASNDQKGRVVESTNVLKGVTKTYSLPPSVFQTATKGGQCEPPAPGAELTRRPLGPIALAGAEPGTSTSGAAPVKSSSWHHSDVLRRSGKESPRDASGQEQKMSHQPAKAMAAGRGRGLPAARDPPREHSGPLGCQASAALLPNQVSVITKQARPETVQNSGLGYQREAVGATAAATDSRETETDPSSVAACPADSHETETDPSSVAARPGDSRKTETDRSSVAARPGDSRETETDRSSVAARPGDSCEMETDPSSVAARPGDRGDTSRSVREVAAEKSPSPDVSTSRGKPVFNSPSGSLPVQSLGCSTSSKSPFSSEDLPVQSQVPLSEHLLQGSPPSPHTSRSDTVRSNTDEPEHGALLPAEAGVSTRCSAEQRPGGDGGQTGSEAPETESDSSSTAETESDSPSTPESERPETPQEDFPESCTSAGPAPSPAVGRVEEAQEVSQSGLSGALCSYTGVREHGEGDTEVEESEAFSCSEAEAEAEASRGHRQGDAEASVADVRPSSAVSCLTLALKDFSLRPFPDADRLSTSEVVTFLESCQLRDCSSGDSVSECSSKGTVSKEMSQELKAGDTSGEKRERRLCEEETEASLEEQAELQGAPSGGAGGLGLAQGSLDTSPQVLTETGQEHHPAQGNRSSEGAGREPHSLAPKGPVNLATAEVTAAAADACSPVCRPSEPPAAAGHAAPDSAILVDGSPRSTPKESDAARHTLSEEEGPEALGGPLVRSCGSAAASLRTDGSPGHEAETTFQCQISTVTSEVISVLINKDQNVVIEKGDHWTIISGVALSPAVEQVVFCDALEDVPAPQDQGGLDAASGSVASMEKSPEVSPTVPLLPELPFGDVSGENVSSCGQSANFDKSRLRNRPVKPSMWISSQIYDQTFETETVTSDHTYYNWKLEPLGKNKNRSKIVSKDQSAKPMPSPGPSRAAQQSESPQSVSGDRAGKTTRTQTQPVVANADTSTPTDDSPDTLSKIRREVGPPLPPLLAPLMDTPPRTSQPLSPLISSSSPASPTSPAGHVSPSRETAGPPVLSPWPKEPQRASPLEPSPLEPSPLQPSPSPSTTAASGRIVSSPLQFCAATPKHALPVPGRLPPGAPSHATVGGPQENSVKILDTMYPELSARARTLSILKGNMQLSRGSSADGKALPGRVSALLGLKAITSSSTAFVKAGGSSAADGGQHEPGHAGAQQDAGGKRALSASTPRSAKRLRLDGEAPEPDARTAAAGGVKSPPGTVPPAEEGQSAGQACSPASRLPLNRKGTVESYNAAVTRALKKIATASFDLLPVIRSHVYVGNISKKPVMRDPEKEVVHEFSTTNKHLGEHLLQSILSELKIQKTSMDHSYIHALCRVYVGICRQFGDLERARMFSYSLLKEDFPESEKLTLFIANMWHDIFLSQSVVSKAMQLVARQRATGEVLNCLRAFLSWEKNAPVDVGIMVSKLLLTIQLCPKTEFQSSEKFGEDLSDSTWEYIFAIDLLCCHQRWIWTHDNIISKELWPVMDKWIKYKKGHTNVAYTPDVIIASILRLIGRLGQLGLKEGFPTAVKNISSVIGTFIRHAQDEDIPWGIQLAAVYALCDLSPSNPAEISQILEAWRRQTSNSIPPAMASRLEEVGSLSAGPLAP